MSRIGGKGPGMNDFEKQREDMVRRQIAARGVTGERVLSAMRSVPRERFVPENLAGYAYEDAPLPIEEGQTISQPYIVAEMIELLGVDEGERVLEIGAGSGYAAAVLSRVAKEVYAVERHETLANNARERLERLGYDNVHILHGDGTLGWEEHAPYEGILVSAGGPEIPQNLLDQLAIGGRLVIPVGADMRSQELVRIRRTGEHEFDEESLGRVQFVPLIGSQGWALDGAPVTPRRERRPIRLGERDRGELSPLIGDHCEPIGSIGEPDLSPLLERIGAARVVLIGEASHGTSEFYSVRARITRELIEHKGFTIVGIEADWPDAQQLNRYAQGRDPAQLRTPAFSRFPTWMWRNRETAAFIEWLREHNAELEAPERAGVYGLDLYSMNNSIGAVLDYLDRADPTAAENARQRYACFSPWEMDPATYGRAAVSGRMESCEADAVAILTDLLAKRMCYLRADGDSFFDAERNATVVRRAESYYRAMYYGSRESWNLRDRHMFDTLEAALDHHGEGSKAVVWAHNSHIGDARATEMGTRGETNIGQLCRERFGAGAYAIGMGTHTGSVAAADNWDEPMRVMRINPSHPDSYERLCHDTGVPAFMLHLRSPRNPDVRAGLLKPHLERAIGVIYRPETEVLSHYFQASLPVQFDEYLWFDQTTPVRPIQAAQLAGAPETYPFAL